LANKSITATSDQLAKPAADTERVSHIVNRIAGLQVGEEDKKLFRLIADNPVQKIVLGIPLYRAEDSSLSILKLGYLVRAPASLAGLCCGPFYYVVLGLKKKGAVLAGILALLAIVAQMFWLNSWILAILIGGGVVNLWSCGMVTYDRYRKLVLDEDFWW
jgi:hypothetical protein